MSLLEKLRKSQEEGRTKKSVEVFDLTDEEQLASFTEKVDENNIIVIDNVERADIQFRTAIIGKAEKLDVVKGKDGVNYQRYALIGRDTKTNSTLRTWTIVQEGEAGFKKGDMAEFPCVHVPKHKGAFANDKGVVALTDNVFQSTGRAIAEKLSAERVIGHMLSTEGKVTSAKAEKVEV